jgi:hypothetical protein
MPVRCKPPAGERYPKRPIRLMREEYRRLTMGIEDQIVRWIPENIAT